MESPAARCKVILFSCPNGLMAFFIKVSFWTLVIGASSRSSEQLSSLRTQSLSNHPFFLPSSTPRDSISTHVCDRESEGGFIFRISRDWDAAWGSCLQDLKCPTKEQKFDLEKCWKTRGVSVISSFTAISNGIEAFSKNPSSCFSFWLR